MNTFEMISKIMIPVTVPRLVEQQSSRIAVPDRDDEEHATFVKKRERRMTE
jgi:hypothetical protein